MSTINLLPTGYQQRRSRRRANVLCFSLFVIIMVGVVCAAWVSENQTDDLRLENEEVCQQYRQAAKSITRIRQLEAQKKQVIEKAKNASALLEKVPRSYLLACLTNALPEGASLTKVQLRSTTPKPTQPIGKPKTKFRSRAERHAARSRELERKITRPKIEVSLEINGLARTDVEVAQFISNMQRNPLLQSVELNYSEEEEIDTETLRHFHVTMQLADNAEVEADSTQTVSTPLPALSAAAMSRRAHR